MSDTDTKEETSSLYEQVVEVTDLTPEEDESPEDFKGRVVRHFSDMEDADYDTALEGREDLAVWVKNATAVYKENRGSRSKSKLPKLEGLEGDDAASESAAKGKSKAKSDGKAKAAKEKAEPQGRDPEANRFFKIAEFLVKNPKLTADELVKAASKTDYSERSIKRVHEAWTGITGAMRKHGMLTG